MTQSEVWQKKVMFEVSMGHMKSFDDSNLKSEVIWWLQTEIW